MVLGESDSVVIQRTCTVEKEAHSKYRSNVTR